MVFRHMTGQLNGFDLLTCPGFNRRTESGSRGAAKWRSACAVQASPAQCLCSAGQSSPRQHLAGEDATGLKAAFLAPMWLRMTPNPLYCRVGGAQKPQQACQQVIAEDDAGKLAPNAALFLLASALSR